MCAEKCLEIIWNIHSSQSELVYNLERHRCKITQCLCTRPKAGSVCSRTQYRSAVLKWSSRRRERSRNFWLPMGTGETAHLSTKEKEGCHVPCDELKDSRRPGAAGYSFPPVNKPPKTNSSTPRRRRRDSETRGKGRQVSAKSDICDKRALREALEEMREDELKTRVFSWKDHQTGCLRLSGLLVRFGFSARTSYFDRPHELCTIRH